MNPEVGRFAPSSTGDAHPGTLLAALLAWLDMRSRGGRVLMRLEDLDRTRVQPRFNDALLNAVRSLAITFDAVHIQSNDHARHIAALDRLEALGLLYPCLCSRSTIKQSGRRAPDGGFAYENTCRHRPLSRGGWRETSANIRVQLPDEAVTLIDESGLDLSQAPSRAMGDPIVLRKDGAVAYQLAVVVDDAAQGVTRVVRGRDIAPSTATQVQLQRLLGLPTPTYRHHFLLLEPQGGKLAKLHGSVGWQELATRYSGPELCGVLACFAGLTPTNAPLAPADLVDGFGWSKVRNDDLLVTWDGHRLSASDSASR